jgi:hypothetical protein
MALLDLQGMEPETDESKKGGVDSFLSVACADGDSYLSLLLC